jgi:hypothetical protein
MVFTLLLLTPGLLIHRFAFIPGKQGMHRSDHPELYGLLALGYLSKKLSINDTH